MTLSKYMMPRTERHEVRTLAGKFRGGKLVPVMAQAFRESEAGLVQQRLTFELDSIPGRLITPITLEVISVFVPALAIDVVKNPLDAYPGNAEIFREKLLSGNPVFGLEAESEVSKRCGVVPRSIGGVKKVNEAVRFAHIAAVNYLRRKKYVNAAQLLNTSAIVTPALIGQTVLERLGGVLNPEDRVNGRVQLGLPDLDLRVRGIGVAAGGSLALTSMAVRETGGASPTYPRAGWAGASGPNNVYVKGEYPVGGPWVPSVYAELRDAVSDGISLSDIYQAERMDALTREMREMVDTNPDFGEQMVARWAAGLQVETGKQPFVAFRKSQVFGMAVQRAMDGASLGEMATNLAVGMSLTVPVPASEFGGILLTFASVKPDETIASQPHPILSDTWGARNYVADELAVDPVPVTMREVDADCLAGDENTVVFYGGHHGLLRSYINYGFTRNTDLDTVEAKTALWQLEVPYSVTPESVIYPADIDHYPFPDQLAEVCTYTIESSARVLTPVIFGPSPVEELAAIEDADVFDDAS